MVVVWVVQGLEVACWGQRLDTVHQGFWVGRVATDAVLSSVVVVGGDTCSMSFHQVRVVEVLVVVLYKLRCLNPLGY